MKSHYFSQRRPDADDISLRKAIDDEIVPEKCLLGGLLVMQIHQGGHDPCEWCPGPREHCGGRPQKHGITSRQDVANLIHVIGEKDSAARRIQRRQISETLLSWAKQEQEKREKNES